jgi:peptidoglycan/LPS O-acetylase OafA/YrhL
MNLNMKSFINLSRWLAAFLVLISHVRHLVLVDYKNVVNKGFFSKGVYFLTGFGHEAVVVFFVISGFLVGGITLDRWVSKGPDIHGYVAARISRIYTVLIPALFIGLFFDTAGLNFFNASELYTNSSQYQTISLNSIIASATSIPTFFGNLLMLQGVLTGNFGSNGALWSLAYEWWYYCIFALIGFAFCNEGNKRFLCIALALVISVLLPNKIILWGAVWLLGVFAYKWFSSNKWKINPLLGFSVFFILMIASRLSHNQDNVENHESLLQEFLRDFILGVAYVIALVSSSQFSIYSVFSKLSERLADFSFSTYLFHFPLMVFFVAVGYQIFGLQFQVQPDWYGFSYALTLVGLLYFSCFIFSLLTEKWTSSIRERLQRFIVGRA